MAQDWRFDVAETFDDDYLYFYSNLLTEERSDEQAELIWRLLELHEGAEVLDLACGHGRIANRLAGKGARVTGLDATPRFLDVARRDAHTRGVAVDYVLGDMRELPWTGSFDAVACVFTAFGYFDDDDNRRVLAQVRRALKPRGRLWVDLNNLSWLLANFREDIVMEQDGSFLIDRNRFDPIAGRTVSDRTVIRDGTVRTFQFSVRVFSFPELRDWLLAAGFREVTSWSGNGESLTSDARRMVVIATA